MQDLHLNLGPVEVEWEESMQVVLRVANVAS